MILLQALADPTLFLSARLLFRREIWLPVSTNIVVPFTLIHASRPQLGSRLLMVLLADLGVPLCDAALLVRLSLRGPVATVFTLASLNVQCCGSRHL